MYILKSRKKCILFTFSLFFFYTFFLVLFNLIGIRCINQKGLGIIEGTLVRTLEDDISVYCVVV